MTLARWRLVMWAVAVLTCVLAFGEALLHPDRMMCSAMGDGLKNYFTFAWHVLNDPSWIHFGGMNYPFGEHVGFTDGHALVSLLAGWIPMVKQFPVGTINLLMMLSLPLTMWIIFELALRHGIRPWIAILAAWTITCMSPQMDRLGGHYSLSYAFWIPLLLLLLSAKRPEGSVIAWWKTVVLITAAFFIHPYHGMMMVLFLFALAVVKLPDVRAGKLHLRSWSFLLYSAIIPVSLFFLFTRLTDTHPKRTEQTFGFFEHTSSVASILLPNQPPFAGFAGHVLGTDSRVWEGLAYIGLFVGISLLIGLIVFAVNRFKSIPVSRELVLMALATIPVLIFSFGFPFTLDGDDWLDRFPLVKQFRAPGRFSWVFYYGMTLLAFALLNGWWTKHIGRRAGIFRLTITLLGSGLCVAEAVPYLTKAHAQVSHHPNLLRPNALPASLKRDIAFLSNLDKRPDCLLPLPYFHFGSDIYARIPDERWQAWAMLMSWHSSIPLAASALSRASLPESRAQLALCSPFVEDAIHGEVLLIQPPAMPVLPVDESLLWNAGIPVQPESAPPMRWLNRSWRAEMVSERAWPDETTLFSGDARIEANEYLLLLSVSASELRQNHPGSPYAVLRFRGDGVALASLGLLVQHVRSGGVEWVQYDRLGWASGQTEDEIIALVALPDCHDCDRIEVALHNPGRLVVGLVVAGAQLRDIKVPG